MFCKTVKYCAVNVSVPLAFGTEASQVSQIMNHITTNYSGVSAMFSDCNAKSTRYLAHDSLYNSPILQCVHGYIYCEVGGYGLIENNVGPCA